MKYLEKKSIVPIEPATGSISDTLNIEDKITNTYSARIIDGLTEIETIENENGRAIKFSNGTMICTAVITHPTLNCTTAYGDYYYFGSVTWKFPTEFIELPDFCFANISFGQIGFVSLASLTEKLSAFNVCLPKSYTRTDAKMRYFAIGRWK